MLGQDCMVKKDILEQSDKDVLIILIIEDL